MGLSQDCPQSFASHYGDQVGMSFRTTPKMCRFADMENNEVVSYTAMEFR